MALSTRGGLAVVLFAFLSAVVACRDERKAETLDRPTALKLLQENGGVGLRVPTWSIDLVVYDTGPAEAARLAFLRSLEPGLLRLASTAEVEAPGFSFSSFAKRPRVKRYEFEPADPKSASSLMRGEVMKVVFLRSATRIIER